MLYRSVIPVVPLPPASAGWDFQSVRIKLSAPFIKIIKVPPPLPKICPQNMLNVPKESAVNETGDA